VRIHLLLLFSQAGMALPPCPRNIVLFAAVLFAAAFGVDGLHASCKNSTCRQLQTAREELRIAVLTSFTGAYAFGTLMEDIVLLAFGFINDDPDFLPGFYFNASFYDSGCNGPQAIEAFANAAGGRNIGVLGPACSVAVEPVAIAAPFARKHQISGTASMSFLDNRVVFPNFFRTIPVESTAEMVDFINFMGWQFFSLVGGESKIADSRRAQERASDFGITLVSFSLIFPSHSECQEEPVHPS